jgi:acetyl-CoA carboxylase biotin carboxyl carrier protein
MSAAATAPSPARQFGASGHRENAASPLGAHESPMTLEEIKELILVVRETGIAELEVQRGENRVRIRSAGQATSQEVVAGPGHVAVGGSQAVVAPPGSPGPGPAGQPTEDENLLLVKSPIVGTFYDAPAPGAAPFVRVGDHVDANQVLCIIESMKLMNEIEAEVGGTVVARLVESGRPVEYGEALFRIRPR